MWGLYLFQIVQELNFSILVDGRLVWVETEDSKRNNVLLNYPLIHLLLIENNKTLPDIAIF